MHSFIFFLFYVFSLFGKSMENVYNKLIYILVNNSIQAEQLIRKPQFCSFNIFNKYLVEVKLKKQSIKLRTPIAIGTTILQLSKIAMYRVSTCIYIPPSRSCYFFLPIIYLI